MVGVPAVGLLAEHFLTPRPDAATATVGALLQGSTLGQAIGPPIFATLATTFGRQSSPIFIGFAGAVTTALGVALHRSIRSAR